MKRIEVLALAFMGSLALASCSSSDACSLKEAAGFDVSEIVSAQASGSVFQSLTWSIPEEAYAYLDCPYIKVDLDINATYLSAWPPSELKEDAYLLRVETDALKASGGLTFFIGHNSKYMYFDGLEATYRSKDVMPSKFIDLLKADNASEASTK